MKVFVFFFFFFESLCLYCASERVSGLPKNTQLERTRGGIQTQVCISPEPALLSPASAIGQKQSHLWGLQVEMAPRYRLLRKGDSIKTGLALS